MADPADNLVHFYSAIRNPLRALCGTHPQRGHWTFTATEVTCEHCRSILADRITPTYRKPKQN